MSTKLWAAVGMLSLLLAFFSLFHSRNNFRKQDNLLTSKRLWWDKSDFCPLIPTYDHYWVVNSNLNTSIKCPRLMNADHTFVCEYNGRNDISGEDRLQFSVPGLVDVNISHLLSLLESENVGLFFLGDSITGQHFRALQCQAEMEGVASDRMLRFVTFFKSSFLSPLEPHTQYRVQVWAHEKTRLSATGLQSSAWFHQFGDIASSKNRSFLVLNTGAWWSPGRIQILKKLQMSKLVVFILLANGKTSITEIYRSKKC
jgi:hypothetical protein